LLLQYLPVIPEMPQFLLFALRSIFRHYYHYYAAIIVPRVGREDPVTGTSDKINIVK